MGAALYGTAARTVDADAALRFENLARSTQYGISARIKSYSDLTRALAALFQTTDNVTRNSSSQYVVSLDMRATSRRSKR
jgi:CHASE1-domain containing sensor protein